VHALPVKYRAASAAHQFRGLLTATGAIQALFETAGKHGCSRVEWTTDSNNADAQAFYEMLGLPKHPSKVFYRVEDTGGAFQIPS
jgi:RimJ/RimL family protein N-acetyltransferase